MFEHYYRELLNFCSRFAKNPEGAADTVQEAYARVLASQKQGKKVSQPRALLYRTARNLMIDQQRRTAVRERYHDESGDVDSMAGSCVYEPETAAMSSQATAAMLATINAMPARRREAFILHRFEGLSHAEVSIRMKISQKMVEQHIKAAMQTCRQSRAQWNARLGAGADVPTTTSRTKAQLP
ncbi:sigma-70 family RNA polymerase sigma factor [Allopusillimonas ginsengisoli]|nr:sigma-70 family RNA polymerase sigma factor [Allopusillimonas ginsengisoli]